MLFDEFNLFYHTRRKAFQCFDTLSGYISFREPLKGIVLSVIVTRLPIIVSAHLGARARNRFHLLFAYLINFRYEEGVRTRADMALAWRLRTLYVETTTVV